MLVVKSVITYCCYCCYKYHVLCNFGFVIHISYFFLSAVPPSSLLTCPDLSLSLSLSLNVSPSFPFSFSSLDRHTHIALVPFCISRSLSYLNSFFQYISHSLFLSFPLLPKSLWHLYVMDYMSLYFMNYPVVTYSNGTFVNLCIQCVPAERTKTRIIDVLS